MAAYLPDEVLDLFKPRDMPPFRPPPRRRPSRKISVISDSMDRLEDPQKTDFSKLVKVVTPTEKRKQMVLERLERHKAKRAEQIREWDPLKNEKVTTDPFKTLFVARLSFATTPETLKRQFSPFGHINQVPIIVCAAEYCTMRTVLPFPLSPSRSSLLPSPSHSLSLILIGKSVHSPLSRSRSSRTSRVNPADTALSSLSASAT